MLTASRYCGELARPRLYAFPSLVPAESELAMSQDQIPTAKLLANWEDGSGNAERLCSDLLRLDDFEDIDPQHPLGGPDGGKDILCSKRANTFVAAAHFPTQSIKFAETQKKFRDDLEASLNHKRDGFIFLTNQRLSVGERSILEQVAASKGKRCLIYHRERLRVMLDSPSGYGLRLRHLGVAMSHEEQAAFFASSGQSVAEALKAQMRAIVALGDRIDRFARQSQNFALETVAVVAEAFQNERTDVPSMLEAAARKSFSAAAADPATAISAQLTPSLLRYVHRLVLPDGSAYAGQFRETQVWLTDQDGKANSENECPPWDKVAALVGELIEDWNRDFPTLVGNEAAVIPAISRFFHQLVWIHPFIDGNGRLAREILALQARELLGLLENPILDRGAKYYSALLDADRGNFDALEGVVSAAIAEAK